LGFWSGMDHSLLDDGTLFIYRLGEEEENLRGRALLFLDAAFLKRSLVFNIFRGKKFVVRVCHYSYLVDNDFGDNNKV